MEAVIYIVLFARTKVAMKANKMLLIIQAEAKGRGGSASISLGTAGFFFLFFLCSGNGAFFSFLSDSSYFPDNLLHNVCFESAV